MTDTEPPATRLSVAICTHNRSAALSRCLAALAPAASLDLIVIDSGSSDSEAEAIAGLAHAHRAQHVRLPSPGLSAARNAALVVAHGAWIAYLDDDSLPAPDWVAVLRATIAATPDLVATGGPILPNFETGLPEWWPAPLRAVLTIIDQIAVDDPAAAAIEPFAANIAFHRETLAQFGGFPACLGRHGALLLSNEETYIIRRLRRAGRLVRFTPDLIVHHDIQSDRLQPQWLIRRQYWSGVSEAVMLAALGEARTARAARMAIQALLLAPLLFWPASSTRYLSLRCTAGFARGFLRGVLTEDARSPLPAL